MLVSLAGVSFSLFPFSRLSCWSRWRVSFFPTLLFLATPMLVSLAGECFCSVLSFVGWLLGLRALVFCFFARFFAGEGAGTFLFFLIFSFDWFFAGRFGEFAIAARISF
jgi:hypothetical protein